MVELGMSRNDFANTPMAIMPYLKAAFREREERHDRRNAALAMTIATAMGAKKKNGKPFTLEDFATIKWQQRK